MTLSGVSQRHFSANGKSRVHINVATTNSTSHKKGSSFCGFKIPTGAIVKYSKITKKNVFPLSMAFLTILFVSILASCFSILYLHLHIRKIDSTDNNIGDSRGPLCSRISYREASETEHIHANFIVNELKRDNVALMDGYEFYQNYIRQYKAVVIRRGFSNETLSFIQHRFSEENMIQMYKSEEMKVKVKNGMLVPEYVLHAEQRFSNPDFEDATLERTDFLIGAELYKIENRSASPEMLTVKDFLGQYRTKSLYAVMNIPRGKHVRKLLEGIRFPGLFADILMWSMGYPAMNLWQSMGGTKSVIHFDAAHNFEHIIEGQKTFYLADNSNTENLYIPKFIKQDGDHYAHEASPVRFENPDIFRYPDFQRVKWHRVDLVPGDIVYIPPYTFHYVDTPADQRSLALNFFLKDDAVTPESNPPLYYAGGATYVSTMLSFIPRVIYLISMDIYERNWLTLQVLRMNFVSMTQKVRLNCFSCSIYLYCRTLLHEKKMESLRQLLLQEHLKHSNENDNFREIHETLNNKETDKEMEDHWWDYTKYVEYTVAEASTTLVAFCFGVIIFRHYSMILNDKEASSKTNNLKTV